MLRKVCTLVLQLLLYVWGLVRRLVSRGGGSSATTASSKQSAPKSEWVNEEWGESWEVKVVPNEDDNSHGNQHGNPYGSHGDASRSNNDLFRDMAPVIKKATTVQLKSSHSQEQHKGTTLQKFSVESTFQNVDDGELGVLCEDGEGWEEGLEEEEGDLLKLSRRALQEKRQQERERRKSAQEILKSQRLTGATQLGLGTRMS